MKTINVLFIRHGESEANVMTFTHWTVSDPGLTQTGRNQCYETKRKLHDEGIKVNKVLCSPLKRAIQSALIVFPRTFITCMPCVAEIGFGLDNICNFSESYPWVLFHEYQSEPSVEKLKSFLKNCNEDETIAIVCHHKFIKKITNKDLANMECVQTTFNVENNSFKIL